MLVERLSQWEEYTRYEYEDDPFIPLDFSNIEGCPHKLQYDVWEKHTPKFDNDQDPSKFFDLFMNFVAKYNFIHEDVHFFHKKTPKLLVS